MTQSNPSSGNCPQLYELQHHHKALGGPGGPMQKECRTQVSFCSPASLCVAFSYFPALGLCRQAPETPVGLGVAASRPMPTHLLSR